MEPGPSYPTIRPKRTVSYFYDGDVGNYSYGYGHPMKPHRMRMTHNLIANYGLDRHMDIIRPKRATREQMSAFHTDEYVDFLSRVSPETMSDLTGEGTKFLIGEDCPAFEGLWEFCTISAGGSLSAAERVNSGMADVAINWAGGLHHAKKREASGFCYVNDIVLAILELLRTHLRVLYIDIDIHHGDGVEEAFYTTDRVLTVSFHKFGDFFPGTGDVRDLGMKKGKGYAVNVPLRDGVSEAEFGGIFRPVLQHIMDWYRPGAVVLQCGADSLAGDKLGCFNLSMKGHADCVKFMQKFDVPLICLGGGGYTIRNVARTWTYETGQLVNKDLDENLPYNDYMQYYGPEYKLDVPQTSMDNQNSREYLEGLRSQIIDNLRSLPCAPSVEMQETPRQSLNVTSLELSDDEDSDLDERISRKLRDAHIERQGDELSGDEDDWEDGGGNDSEMDSERGGKRSTKKSAGLDLGGVGMARGSSGRSLGASSMYSNGRGPGIAGGRRGSAPWKSQSFDHDLEARYNSSSIPPSQTVRTFGSGPFGSTVEKPNMHFKGLNGSSKPKRSFFAARAAGVAVHRKPISGFTSADGATNSGADLDITPDATPSSFVDPDGSHVANQVHLKPSNGFHHTSIQQQQPSSSYADSDAADSPAPAIRDSSMMT